MRMARSALNPPGAAPSPLPERGDRIERQLLRCDEALAPHSRGWCLTADWHIGHKARHVPSPGSRIGAREVACQYDRVRCMLYSVEELLRRAAEFDGMAASARTTSTRQSLHRLAARFRVMAAGRAGNPPAINRQSDEGWLVSGSQCFRGTDRPDRSRPGGETPSRRAAIRGIWRPSLSRTDDALRDGIRRRFAPRNVAAGHADSLGWRGGPPVREWRNGNRRGLKNPRRKLLAGSSPASRRPAPQRRPPARPSSATGRQISTSLCAAKSISPSVRSLVSVRLTVSIVRPM
jgi:hypothetical protein